MFFDIVSGVIWASGLVIPINLNAKLTKFDGNNFTVVSVEPISHINHMDFVASSYSSYPFKVKVTTNRPLEKNKWNEAKNMFYTVGSPLLAKNEGDEEGFAFQFLLNKELLKKIVKTYPLSKPQFSDYVVQKMDTYVLARLANGSVRPSAFPDYFL